VVDLEVTELLLDHHVEQLGVHAVVERQHRHAQRHRYGHRAGRDERPPTMAPEIPPREAKGELHRAYCLSA
jgi:hypothetical protein